MGPAAAATATAVSFAVGYVVVSVFLRMISALSFTPFVIYRILLGIILLALLWAGVIPATA